MFLKNRLPLTLLSALLFTLPAQAEHHHAIEALQEYMEFATYSSGAISPEQLEHEGYEGFYIVDTRNSGQYNSGHLPNAINIEWRDILSKRDQLPQDKPILLYCETGLLSAKAHLALSVAGFENVKVLWGGYIIWSARQTFDDAKRLKDALTPKQ